MQASTPTNVMFVNSVTGDLHVAGFTVFTVIML
jgi:hypothetical protein